MIKYSKKLVDVFAVNSFSNFKVFSFPKPLSPILKKYHFHYQYHINEPFLLPHTYIYITQKSKYTTINFDKNSKNFVSYKKYNRKLINCIVVSSFLCLIWYFLYYRNRRIINDFIDFEIKRGLSRFITTNTAIISILSHELYKYCSKKTTQEQFNKILKEKVINNQQLLISIKVKIKNEIIKFLSSKEGEEQFCLFLTENIKKQENKDYIKEYLYNYLNGKDKQYLLDLLEMKMIQMINNEEFRKYVFEQVANETYRILQDKENINYTIENINNQFKL